MRQSLRINQYIFQSTLSVRRATGYVQEVAEHVDISIHALRKESDLDDLEKQVGQYISIHALRKESDTVEAGLRWDAVISIHALRKESDAGSKLSYQSANISIHALRKESDGLIIGELLGK